MLQQLKLAHLPAQYELPFENDGRYFVLKTCQRTFVLGFHFDLLHTTDWGPSGEVLLAEKAYHFLLETICGLKSRLLGENEIVSQFKQAYAEYLKLSGKNPFVLNVMHKLFQDAKNIRSKYLTHIGQQSYAGIAKKIIFDKGVPSEVLLFGTGNLANDIIKLLKKKTKLILCGRNEQKISDAKRSESLIETLSWDQRENWTEHPFVINTISAQTDFYDQNHFEKWKKNHRNKKESGLFIDLSYPSMLNTHYAGEEGVIRLKEVFEKGSELDKEKQIKIYHAKTEILKLSQKRKTSFAFHYPFGWEELQFA